jgi:hypothetical protein
MPEEDSSTTATGTDANEGTEQSATADANAGKDNGKSPDEAAVEAADKPDAVKNAIRRHQEDARKERKRAEAAEAKAKEFEDRDKSAQEKAEAKAAEAEKRAAQAEFKLLRTEVGRDKKLPASIAELLSGDTKEQMEAHADKLLEDLKPTAAIDFDGGVRPGGPAKTDMDSMIRRAAGRQ